MYSSIVRVDMEPNGEKPAPGGAAGSTITGTPYMHSIVLYGSAGDGYMTLD